MKRVLIVDDSAMIRVVVKKTLSTMGVSDVIEAEDGLKALEQFKSQEIDLVFSDWNMPNMTGLELVREIRKLNTTVPIMMITTEGSREKVVAAIQEGVNDYLVKPFTPASLRAKLEKWATA